VAADQFKDGKPVLIANDRLAINQAGPHWQLADVIAIKGSDERIRSQRA
jgi:hypothetical protein